MQVDLVIATYNRADQLRETLQNVLEIGAELNKIYVVNNNSADHTKEVLDEFSDERIIAIHNERNLGAAGGKNIGLRKSSADVIIVIDDDAIFCSNDPINVVRKSFKENPKLGVIQFKIINFSTKKILKYEFPGDDPDARGGDEFEIGYFIGAGHAIRKNMLDAVGYYPDDFGLYAHEEVDLSYRAINKGYVMRYVPSVAVFHKKDPSGRLPKDDVIFNMFYNRLVMTWKYLPFPYSLINNFLWFVKTIMDSRSLVLAFSAYSQYRLKKSTIHRDVLLPQAMAYMRRNRGRLFR